jgi:hypothetical protein
MFRKFSAKQGKAKKIQFTWLMMRIYRGKENVEVGGCRTKEKA